MGDLGRFSGSPPKGRLLLKKAVSRKKTTCLFFSGKNTFFWFQVPSAWSIVSTPKQMNTSPSNLHDSGARPCSKVQNVDAVDVKHCKALKTSLTKPFFNPYQSTVLFEPFFTAASSITHRLGQASWCHRPVLFGENSVSFGTLIVFLGFGLYFWLGSPLVL